MSPVMHITTVLWCFELPQLLIPDLPQLTALTLVHCCLTNRFEQRDRQTQTRWTNTVWANVQRERERERTGFSCSLSLTFSCSSQCSSVFVSATGPQMAVQLSQMRYSIETRNRNTLHPVSLCLPFFHSFCLSLSLPLSLSASVHILPPEHPLSEWNS